MAYMVCRTTVRSWIALLLLASPHMGLASTSEYLLGPEDVLSVTVLRHPELSASSLTVTDDGMIRLPVVGELAVAGKTIGQVQAAVTEGLRTRLLAPEATVAVVQQRTRVVFVLGVAKSPGVFPMKPGWRVTEALAAAGGLQFRPDEVKGVLLRGEREKLDLDLQAALGGGDPAANLALQPGDVINTVRRSIQISVAGSVIRPGTYEMSIGGGVLDAIGIAGGVTAQAETEAVIVQGLSGEQRQVDLLPLLLDGRPIQDPPLAMGDMVVVPARNARTGIIGAVKQPGTFELSAGVPMRVTDLIARAGGLLPRAELTSGLLFRQNGEVVTLDMEDILTTGSAAANLELAPGDMVSISEQTMQVNVVGQVERPGPQLLPVGSGVVQAIAAAGGVLATSALHEVVIKSVDGRERVIDLYAVLVGGKFDHNETLSAGDTLLVPESRAKVAVLGQVKNPGYYPLDADNPATVVELIAMAGGPLSRGARVDETTLIRVADGKPQPIKVNLHHILRDGKIANDQVVQDRDVIYVPAAKTDWELILRTVGSLSVLGGWLLGN